MFLSYWQETILYKPIAWLKKKFWPLNQPKKPEDSHYFFKASKQTFSVCAVLGNISTGWMVSIE